MNDNFDPQTGKPLNQGAPSQPEGSFHYDPETGERIMDGVQPSQPEGSFHFDTETGERIMDTPQSAQSESPDRFDPETGQPLIPGQPASPVKRKGKLPVILGSIAAVLALAAVAVLLVLFVFQPPAKRIAVAALNTFRTDHLMKALNAESILKDGKYTAAFEGSVRDAELSLKYAADVPAKTYSLGGSFGYEGTDVAVSAYMDDKQIAAQAPDLTEYTLVYNYTDKKTGYLSDFLKDHSDLKIEDLDKLIAFYADQGKQDKANSGLKNSTVNLYKKLKFKRVDKKVCEVNGKDHKCSGYKTTVTKEAVKEWWKEYKSTIKDYYKGLGYATRVPVSIFGLSSSLDQLDDAIKDMHDVDITVYLYKKQFANLLIKGKNFDSEIEFLGGETPCQNISARIKADGDKVRFEKTGETDKTSETAEYTVEGTTVLTTEYDFKNGDLSVEAGDGDNRAFELTGKLLSSDKEISFELDQLKYMDEKISTDARFSLKKGSAVEKLSDSAKVFDMGNAEEDDWDKLVSDISSEISDKF